jgi:hypothetical protein
MTPYHDTLLATGWTTHDGRLYRRKGFELAYVDAAWRAKCAIHNTHRCPTPDAALAALRERLQDRIAEAQRALEDLG